MSATGATGWIRATRWTRAIAAMRRRLLQRLGADDGTMTILITGVLVVILMTAGVTTAITGIHLDRNRLQHAADGAALAAAQAIGPDGVYSPDGSGAVDPALAEQRARDHLRRAGALPAHVDAVEITGLEVASDGTVQLHVEARTRPLLIGRLLEATSADIPLTVVGEARSS